MISTKKRVPTRIMLLATILTLVLLLMSPRFINAESKYVEVIDIDSDGYSKEVSSGEAATYEWTLENIDEYNRTLNVSISLSNSNTDWTTRLEPDTIITLSSKGDVKPVRLTVTAPSYKDEGSTKVTLTFTIESDGVPVHHEERITITSLPTEPEERKVIGLFTNPLPEPLDNEWGVFLLTLLIWLVFSLILVFLLGPLVKSFTRKTKTKIDDIILKIIRVPVFVLVFFYGLISSLRILEDHIHSVIFNIINSIYGIAMVLILFYVAYRLFKDILVYYSKQIAVRTATNVDDVLVPVIEKVGVIVLGLVALGYILGFLNIDLTIFIAGGVVISMVLAFAAQETLSNFFSGIFILTDRPFKVGDTIILPDEDWYEVRKIGLRSTRLFRFKDASLVSIPNNQLANEKIANFTNPDDLGRIMKTFTVAYGSDTKKVKKVIREVIEANPDIVTDDEDLKPIIRFDEMAESSINFFILVWIKDRDERFNIMDYLNTEIYRRFNEEGIEIPYPQRVVHLKEKKGD
ncbi:mechanosensitive ion channel domain-containing protein [[Eubacterium] cellulosolvens]